MYRTDPRTPRKTIPMKCSHCGRAFVAFRSSARYCSDTCRSASHKVKTDYRGRQSALEKYEYHCSRCGASKEERKMYTRKDPTTGECVTLCSSCNSSMSRRLFLSRVPSPGKGYAKEKACRKRQDLG